MNKVLRIRHQNDLWWSTITYETALTWDSLRVIVADDKNCIIQVNDDIVLELKQEDYEKIIDDKAFNLKFGLKKHSF
jgi:hypothetical protein